MQASKILLTLFSVYGFISSAYSAENTTAFEYIKDITAVDLGTLPNGKFSTARDINDGGYIVGTSDMRNVFQKHLLDQISLSRRDTTLLSSDKNTPSLYQKRAFVIDASGMRNLGTFAGGSDSYAYGISDNGYIVGAAYNSSHVMHGFSLRYNVMRDLGAYPPEDNIGSSSWAYAVNNAALVAGNIDLAGVVWDLNGVPNFPPFPPNVRVTDPGKFKPSIAYDINNEGQAVGTLLGMGTAFRWSAGKLETLKGLGLADEDAFGINNRGQVVGQALLAPPVRYHAVLWSNPATIQDLGTLGGENSSAQDINDDYTVVGYSETATGQTHAFIWRPRLGMRSLGTLGGNNSKAFAINAHGVIVGESETASGEVHATRWTVSICTADITTTQADCN